MKKTRAFIAALALGCLCSIVSADVTAHKLDTTSAAPQHPDPAPHSEQSSPHPHPKAPTAAATVDASSAKVSTTLSTTTTTSPPVCGNGIIEHGEECDCGSPQECAKDPCCSAKTCKLNAGAQCSNQQECCDKCQYRPSTFICRSATSDCDAVEMCSGKSAKCPANKKTCPKSHSSVPSNSSISCGAEACTERDLQCQSQSDSSYTFATACAITASSCQISCTDPTDAPASSHSPRCVNLLVNFEDGTACGQGGVCSSGVCNGDKSSSAFYKKNTITFAVGGGCIVVAFFFCFFGIFCSRRRKRLQKEKDRKQEDSYQMSETNDRDLYRKSNIRIGLDPSDNGMVDVLMPYDGSQGSSSLTRRPSAGALSTKARAGGSPSTGPYAADSLMTEQEMALDLESDANQRMGPTLSNWPAPPSSRERTGYFDMPPPSHPLPAINATGSKGKGTLQKSPSVGNHIVYVPPPLPPPAIATPTSKLPGVISPYADEAMIVFPPDSPPRSVNSGGGSKKPSNQQSPVIRIGEVATPSSQDLSGTTTPDKEPSFLDLNNSLSVDRYRADSKSPAKDRTSVNSFFSGLAMDEPTPESYSLPPILPEPSFASEEYVMPAPIARVIPVPTARGISPSSPSPTTVTPPLAPSSATANKPKSAYERQQEEIQIASCFAQDLGFEIVHPSPTGSPRHKAATPTGSRRL